MSLLDSFQEFFVDDIEVYSLTASTSSWGASEKEYPATATRTISGYIQPGGGSATQQNAKRGINASYTLYMSASEAVLDTDRIKYNGETYQVVFNAPAGIGGISDHKEVGLEKYGG